LTKRNREKRHGWTGGIRSIDVGERLRIVPYWEGGLASSDRLDIILDPGPAFGAGNHPATFMALQLIEIALNRLCAEVQFPSMLDLGTGTAILAIAAKRLGAGFTVGVDIDAAAIYSARRNLQLNGLKSKDSVELLIGGVESVRGTFNIVTANLVAPLLLELSRNLGNLVEKFLVVSGVADAMAPKVLESFSSQGFTPIISKNLQGWNAALLSRQ
jgi:ribosomal protein L11 methyltransferase